MGARSKAATKTRSASEFDIRRLASKMKAPTSAGNVYAWTLAEIFSARDAQIRGQFARPAQMAVSMRTNAAIGVARRGRLAPQKCIKVELVAAKGAGAGSIQNEATASYGDAGVAFTPGTRADVEACLVDHGVAFGYNVWTPREDGSRTDCEVRFWPIEHVRWDEYRECYVTRVSPDVETNEHGDVEIIHGDGRWIIWSLSDHKPHQQDAALLDACVVWASNAYAQRDWAKSSVAHGNVKMIGQMPDGVPLADADGNTSDADAMIDLMRDMVSGEAPVGLIPFGAKADFVAPGGTNYQVFSELVLSSERLAARIYLGTDGTLGSNGGAPGVDIGELFGVATTKVQGDLGAISRGVQTGSIEIWAALNFGSSEKAPTHRYMIPDADADADKTSLSTRRQAFYADVEGSKKSGAVVDQAFVDELAKAYDVEPFRLPVAPAPVAAPAAPPAPLRLVPPPTPPGPDPETMARLADFDQRLNAVASRPAPVVAPPPPVVPFHERNASFLADLRDYEARGLTIDIDQIAALHGVPAPRKVKGS